MRWWGWIGIAVILLAANYYKQYMYVTTAYDTNVSEGYGLCTIGYALSHVPSAMLFLASGLMIWISARDKKENEPERTQSRDSE